MITKDKQKTSEDSTNARRRICEYVEYIPREKKQGYINLSQELYLFISFCQLFQVKTTFAPYLVTIAKTASSVILINASSVTV